MTTRAFRSDYSEISTQGSKLIIAFDEFDELPDVSNPGAVSLTVRHPVYGSDTPTVDRVLTCKDARADLHPTDPIHLITCHLDEDIHDIDTVQSTISLDPGWAQTMNDSSGAVSNWTAPNNSTVAYPKPIVSWDMVPHQVYSGKFHVDLAIYHRYTYENSPYGDFEVEVWVDDDPTNASGPNGAAPSMTATVIPSIKCSELRLALVPRLPRHLRRRGFRGPIRPDRRWRGLHPLQD